MEQYNLLIDELTSIINSNSITEVKMKYDQDEDNWDYVIENLKLNKTNIKPVS